MSRTVVGLAIAFVLLPLIAAKPSTKPSGRPFRSTSEVLDVLPPLPGYPNDFQYDKADRVIKDKVIAHPLAGRFGIASVYHEKGGEIRFRPICPIRNGYALSLELYIDSPTDDLIRRLESFQSGDTFQLRGEITSGQLSRTNGTSTGADGDIGGDLELVGHATVVP